MLTVEDRVDTLETVLQRFIINTDTSFNNLSREIDRVSQNVDNLSRKIDRVSQNVDNLSREVDRVSQNVDNLSREVDRVSQNVDNLSREVDRVSQNVDNLSREVDRVSQNVDNLSREVDRVSQNVDNLSREVDRVSQNVDNLSREVDRVSQNVDRQSAEFALFREEARQERILMNKKWGEITNKMGTFVEDMVAPNIKGIAKRYFGCKELDDFMLRRHKRHSIDRTRRREFDVIAVCGDKVILNETKSNVRIDYIEDFIKLLDEFFDYFPEYRGKELIPVFASLYIGEDFIAYLTKHGIYAMAIKEDTMDLLNFEAVSGIKV